jgi:hypothetical protein
MTYDLRHTLAHYKITNREKAMGAAEMDRRKRPDMRDEDSGPPKGTKERRINPERRTTDMLNLDIDEDIYISEFRDDEIDITGSRHLCGDW